VTGANVGKTKTLRPRKRHPRVEWCDGALRVVATGTSSFVNLADRELQVSLLARVR